jgi:hypothetical protein
VNIAGGRRSPPLGELDVWLPVTKLPEVVGASAEKIREALKREFATTEAGVSECVVRLKSPDEAQKFVSLVREWIATPISQTVAASTPKVKLAQ